MRSNTTVQILRVVDLTQFLSSSEACLLAFVFGCCATLLPNELITPMSGIGLMCVAFLIVLFAFRCSTLWPLVMLIVAFVYSSYIFDNHFQKSIPRAIESKNIRLIGRVVGLPDLNTIRTQFLFRVDSVQANIGEQHDDFQPAITKALSGALVHELVQLSCYRCPTEVLPMQKWQLTVRLKNPHGFASWGAFDFEKYLFRHEVVARGYVRIKEINTLLSDRSHSIDSFRSKIRNKLANKLDLYPQGAGMIAALMIGDKSLLTQQQKRSFQITGVSHLMAISGLHVGLVFFAIAWLFQYFLRPLAKLFNIYPRQQLVLLPALAGAATYSALAGFSVSTERALTMLLVFVLCRVFARTVSLLKVLLIAMVILLVIDPFSILDIGFWLSCGAVLVIAAISYRYDSISLLGLQPMLWLGMLPLTSLFFGQVSMISPLVNLLMVPIFCVAIIPLVLVILVLDQVGFSPITDGLLVLLARFLELTSNSLSWASQLSFASWFPPILPLHCLILMTITMFAYLIGGRGKLLLGVFTILTIYLSQDEGLRQGEFDIALLDVGQGLSMVIEVKDYVLVYDTGPAYPSGFNVAEAVLIPYLRQRGINEIDQLIISHADNDHIGGLDVLRSAFDIDQILTSRVDKIPDAVNCQTGQSWQVSDVKFRIISPDPETPQGSNNRSCVLRIDNGVYSALITGDIEKQVEAYLVENNEQLRSDIMLVPHQGSKTSSTEIFINAVKPKLGLIAAGYRNHYGHPHPKVVRRYTSKKIPLLSNVESGSILLNINKTKWSHRPFRLVSQRFWHRQKKPN